jgi:hypothetical protein
MIDVLKSLIRQFMPFAQQEMGFDRPPKLFLRQDEQNAANPLGKTGFYDPENESITLYTTNRHPKDIMRSLAHELQHHTQKCNGDFDNMQNMGEEGYAQNNPHMRTMEIQAYQASIVFRDWEDSCKGTIYYEHLQKGDNVSMSTKKWKNRELNGLLMERFGFDFKPLAENLKEGEEKPDGDGDGVPPWADKDDDDPDVQEESVAKEDEEESVEDRLAGPTVKAERTKRDSPDRVSGRDAGGRRVKPLEEEEEAGGEEEEDPLLGPTVKRQDVQAELKIRKMVREAIAKAEAKKLK